MASEIFGIVACLVSVGVLIGFGDRIIRNAADALIDDTLDLREGVETPGEIAGGGKTGIGAGSLGNETTGKQQNKSSSHLGTAAK